MMDPEKRNAGDSNKAAGYEKLKKRSVGAAGQLDPFVRAENEDDDGYDPYSDRRPAREPMFMEDPWR